MAVSDELLANTISIIADYREGEIDKLDAAHIRTWLEQFDGPVQESLITELNHVLRKTYISKKQFERFLENLVACPDLTGGQPKQFWERAKFLDIQSHGSSQHVLLDMLGIPLKQQTGLAPADCGNDPACFIYLDDGLYSGNTIKHSLAGWLKEAPSAAVTCP